MALRRMVRDQSTIRNLGTERRNLNGERRNLSGERRQEIVLWGHRTSHQFRFWGSLSIEVLAIVKRGGGGAKSFHTLKA